MAGAPGWRERVKVRMNVCAKGKRRCWLAGATLSSSWATTSLRDYVITRDAMITPSIAPSLYDKRSKTLIEYTKGLNPIFVLERLSLEEEEDRYVWRLIFTILQ